MAKPRTGKYVRVGYKKKVFAVTGFQDQDLAIGNFQGATQVDNSITKSYE